jgi:hypothetical protein
MRVMQASCAFAALTTHPDRGHEQPPEHFILRNEWMETNTGLDIRSYVKGFSGINPVCGRSSGQLIAACH